jgi:RsiW-degrading membrane proteinase PrsW (M82 family)
VKCACGAAISAPSRLAGRRVKCPKCAQAVALPAPEPGIDFAAPPESPEPPARAVKPAPAPVPAEAGWRVYARWALALALVPLIISVFTPDDNPLERLQHMVEQDPKLEKKIGKVRSLDDLRAALPDHRIEGAFHSADTMAHWIYAIGSAVAFWAIILVLYPLGRSTSRQLWMTGVFVGTIGIVFLIAVQYVAAWTQGMILTGRSILIIFFYIIKFIGFSYRAALDPSNGFFLSMLGFTFGVGLCEELCKSLPLLWHFKKTATLDVRGAVVWGLAAGIGFGVSEGITYSSDTYNGVTTGGIYVVRFVSCVALHAIWSGTNALFLWWRQAELDAIDTWYEWFLPILLSLGPAMVLHGLYDTLLKKGMEIPALLSAAASFALFFFLYERAIRDEATLAPRAA